MLEQVLNSTFVLCWFNHLGGWLWSYATRKELPLRFLGTSETCVKCVVCGVELTATNSSEVKNVCKSCLHDLEF
jgi:hypothetical protein